MILKGRKLNMFWIADLRSRAPSVKNTRDPGLLRSSFERRNARLSILPGESGPTFRYRHQVKCAYEDYIDYDIHKLASLWFWFDYFFLKLYHLKRVEVKNERKREFLVSNF